MKWARTLACVGALALTSLPSVARADHHAPSKGPVKQITLVRSYAPCTAPDAELAARNRPPMIADACVATPTSPLHYRDKGAGTLKLNVVKKPNVNAIGKLAGVEDANGPYTGDLSMLADVRISDNGCGQHCTVIDLPPIPIGFAGACTKGKCSFKTSFNDLAQGIIVSGEEMNMQFAKVQVLDGNGQIAFQDGIASGPAGKTKAHTSSLVSALGQCTAPQPGLFHHSPLALSACSPQSFSTLHFGGKSQGVVNVTVTGGGDVKVGGNIKGVIDGSSPYNGGVAIAATVRLTDRGCAGNVNCTLIDQPLTIDFPGACENGKCKLKPAALSASMPDLVRPADQLNLELTRLSVLDAIGQPAFEGGVAVP